MADGRFPDSPDDAESTPTEPTGAELAGNDTERTPVGDQVETPPELTSHADIVDPRDTPEDQYVDDPATVDVNEAKLDRATDEAAAEATQDPGSTAPRRPRRNRPVRRGGSPDGSAGDASGRMIEPVEVPAGDVPASANDEVERAAAGPARGGGRTRTTAPVRRVRTQTESDADKRTTPALFVKQSVGELRKVVWPTGNQVQQYFIVVLVFVLFIMTFVSLLDLGVGWLMLRMFG